MQSLIIALKTPLNWFKNLSLKGKFQTPLWWIKWTQYEYWDWYIFYVPILPYWLYLAIRARSFTYFTATNPAIEAGGFFGESKKDILDKIPSQYLPKTIFIPERKKLAEIINLLITSELYFPIIAKPNVGERGFEVEKIYNEQELENYLTKQSQPFIIQEFIDFPIELGVLFYRLPNENQGKVSSVTLKNFLTVIGDGNSSIEELLNANPRARFQIKRLKNKMGNKLQEILPAGKELLLEPIGNHCRGTEFLNANHLINNNLHKVFNQVALPIEGFYYGRFDLKVSSYEDLYTGKNIRIMELNGASSEPGHIYDTRHTLWRAYRDLTQHWYWIWQISCQNHKKGVAYVPYREIIQLIYRHFFVKKPTLD